MFGTATNEPLPASYLTDYDAWDDYMAQVWAGVLESCKLSAGATIIEVAPGSSTKIGRALKSLDFRGTLYVVDACESLLTRTVSRYRELLPHASIHAVANPLRTALASLPCACDFLLSNHSLDDMVVSFALEATQFETIFGWAANPQNAIAPDFLGQWQQLIKDAKVGDAISQAARDWQLAAQACKPSHLILSQYASSALANDSGLQQLNAAGKETLRMLRKNLAPSHALSLQAALNRNTHYNNPYIGTEVLNGENWLFIRS